MDKNTELYNSAFAKIQKLYSAFFDNDGNLKPEFYLNDEEIEALHTYSNNLGAESKHQLENISAGITYIKCSIMLKKIREICAQIEDLYYYHYYYQGEGKPTFYPMYISDRDHSENIYYEISHGGDAVSLNLKDLDGGIYDCQIEFKSKYNQFPEFEGNVTIRKDKREEEEGTMRYTKFGSEVSYDIIQISSQEAMNALLVAEERLLRVLNNVKTEFNSKNVEQIESKKI